MTTVLISKNRPLRIPLLRLGSLIGTMFRQKAVISANRHEFSDHLLRDLGVFDGDRSDGRFS